ncbi:MAG: YjiH family protein [Pseudomonadales bacterium]
MFNQFATSRTLLIDTENHAQTSMSKLHFLLPSAIGILLFLTPISWGGDTTVGIGVITNWLKNLMGAYGLHVVIALTIITSILTVLGTTFRVEWIQRHVRHKNLFVVSPIWLALRLFGMAFGLIYFFQVGPELLISESIGGAVFVGIGVNVIAVYVVACLLLPLLTEFGLMEFVGTLSRPLFRRVFKLPGQAAIDALTSIVGASAIGLLITIDQYGRGNYTAREASVIATNFSIVSLPFCLVIASVAGIEHFFLPWYGMVILACLMAAFITPRLPPLSRKADTYITTVAVPATDNASEAQPLLVEAWRSALQRAQQAPGIREFFATGLVNLSFFLFSVVTASLALATIASLLVFHTPIFNWLGSPLIALLEFAQLPEPAAAAPALFSGFLDQYMPAIAAGRIESSSTSFVLAGLSVCQLVFMSEVGVIILRSNLPIRITDLVTIFLLRTAIVLPVLVVGAHLVVS